MNHSESISKLVWAVVINILLTVVQVVAGVMSGSLSLLADALHNLSDACAIVVAIIARVIGNRPPNRTMPYGYKRAEMIGVLINSTTLIIVGVYLVFEAINKYFDPTPINGWIVFAVAGFALVVDLATAYITYKFGAKDNMNIKAAFIHNVSDAAASLVVVIAGLVIVFYQMYIIDVIATLLISIYVIYHGVILLYDSVRILMQATPKGVDIDDVARTIADQDNIKRVNSVRVWQSNDSQYYLDARVEISGCEFDSVIFEVKRTLDFNYGIKDSIIEVSNVCVRG
ncbi:cation diffusion facilitator family transporter [Vibrio crassostreae]|uniref:cation diffusion facilitator family transporter n=1 Tax=Vibrio crassostreae TaxID=246167 RepID=UPI002E195268|nr:cation diffusion facilitator family transporter [Vibrio crassostreae]